MCRLLSKFSKWPPLPWKPLKTWKNLKCSELDETFQKFCLTCVHIILKLRNFRMAAVAPKKREKLKVLRIGWNLIEMLYGMCINGLEAWKFQNACHCHGNRKNTKFSTKVNNNLLGLEISKWSPLPWKLFLNLQHKSFSLKSPTSYSVWQTSFAFDFMLII